MSWGVAPLFLALGVVICTPCPGRADVSARPGVGLSVTHGEYASSRPAHCDGADTDLDGVCDEIEAATGTKPLRADTDADGVPDGEEDADHDGVVDPGETDPRVPGLFPGRYPHIPEPMSFDLVRGLGARKGEVEVNSLAVLDLRREQGGLSWAPEVEWAFADGVALEFELPIHNRDLEALKAAVQASFPTGHERIIHGVQVIGEYLLDSRNTEVTGLYLLGGRAGPWSSLLMVGARAITPMRSREHYEVLFNPSIYNDVTESFTVGVEGNLALALAGPHALAIIPQLHWQLSTRVRVQLGGGMQLEGRALHPLIATRVVLE